MNCTVITRNIHVNLYTINKQEQMVKSRVEAKTKVYCPSFKAEMLWLKSHAGLFGCRWACVCLLYFFFVFFSMGLKGTTQFWSQQKKEPYDLSEFQNRLPRRWIAGDLQRGCARIPTSASSASPGRTGGGGACVFASLFSSVKVLCVRVRALSLRSLTRPGPRSLAEPIAVSHSAAPCQLSGSMSNLYE